MLILQDILSQEIVQRLGWTLLHFIWQAAAVALILTILLRVLRKSTANLRYIITCLALALIVLLPVITIKLVPVSLPPTAADFAPVPAPTVLPIAEIPAPETIVIAKPSQSEIVILVPAIPLKQRVVDTLEPALPYIVSGWLIGVFGLSLWHLGGWTQLQRLKRRMVKQVDSTLLNKLKVLIQKLKVKQTVRLMESALVQIPTVVGWLRPVILLPASALTGLNTEQLEAIIAHELAHIKRFDYLINILQTVVEILGFYHPAMWWVSHKIRAERENCCDDMAVSISGDRVSYAGALASMEEIRAANGKLAVAATGGNLFRRICRLLGKDSTDNTGLSWVPAATVILLIIALAIPTTLALTNKSKPQQATLKVDSNKFSPTTCTGQVVDSKGNILTSAQLVAYEMYFDKAGNVKLRPIDNKVTKDNEKFLFKTIPSVKKNRSLGGIIIAQKEGLAVGWANWPLYDGNHQAVIALQEPAKMSGKVVDDNGKPIPNAEVRAVLFEDKTIRDGNVSWLPGIRPSDCLSAHTDRNGRFEFDNTPQNVTSDFLVTAPGFGTFYSRKPDRIDKGYEWAEFKAGQTDIRITISPEAGIEGKLVHDKTGKGMAGITLRVIPDFTPVFFERYLCTTQEDGTFSIGGLRSGKYVIMRAGSRNLKVGVEVESGKTKRNVILKYPFDVRSTKSAVSKPADQIPPAPVLATSPAPPEQDKAQVVKANFIVIEVPLDSKIDTDTLKEAEKLLGNKVRLRNTKVDVILRQAAKATAKEKSTDSKRITEQQFNALAKMLDSKGCLKILMNPTIETLNGKTAIVKSTQHVPLQQVINSAPDGYIIRRLNKNGYVEVGDLIEITPHVFEDGHIILDVKADLGSPKLPAFEAFEAFENTFISSRKLSTQVRANPGESVIIGGLVKNHPLPGDNIKNIEQQANELLFILTPTIVNTDNDSEQKTESAHKLKLLGLAVAMYADDHDDNLPESIQELKPYIRDSQDFDWIVDNVEYFDKGKTAQHNTHFIPIAYDKTMLEKADGTNVLFLDFSARFVDTKEFEKLDIKRAEFLIKTWFLAVTEDFIENINHNADSMDEAEELFKLKSELLAAINGSNQMSFIPPEYDVGLLLKAVRAHKDSKIIASPHVLCRENKTAEISVMNFETYYIVGYTEPNSPSEKPQPKLEKVEEGISMSLRPKLTPNKNIDMEFELEVIRVPGFEEKMYKGKYPYKLPTVQSIEQATRYTAKNGQTLLFGAYKIADQQDDGRTEQKDLLVLITAHTIGSSKQDKPAKAENLAVTAPPTTTTNVITPPTIAKSKAEREKDNEQEKTKPPTDAKISEVPKISEDYPLSIVENKNQVVQKSFKLKHYSPLKMGHIIKPLVGEHGHVSADEDTGTLLVIDTVKSLMRIELIIEQFDVPKVKADETVTEIFEIRNGDPVEIVEILKKLINGPPGNGAIIEQGKKPIVLIPEPVYKWIIAKASPENINQIGQWIKKLDIKKSLIGLDPIDKAVHEQLETIVDLSDFTPGMSFGKVIERLKVSVAPPVQIQPIWKDLLENAEVEQATPAGMDPLTGIKLRKALEILINGVTTSQLGKSGELTYIVDDGVIVIGTAAMLPPKTAHRTYDTSDLVEATDDAVKAPENIKKIARSIKILDTDKPIGMDPIDVAVHEQLETIVDLSDLALGMPFAEVVEKLENSVQPPLQIQPIWKDLLENAEVEQATPAGMDPLTGIRLRKALEILIASVTSSQLGESGELTYIVDDGVIVIGTVRMLPPKMVHRVYDISDLVETPTDADALIRRITEKIEPDSWFGLSNKGEGTILAYPVQQPKKFAVMQPYKIHQQIELFLDGMRSPTDQLPEPNLPSTTKVPREEPTRPLDQIQQQLDELIKQRQALKVTEPNVSVPKVKLISNTFIDCPLIDALQSIAAAADVNIITDETVKGFISCTLKDVTVKTALDIILAGTPYTWKKTPDCYMVVSGVDMPKMVHRVYDISDLVSEPANYGQIGRMLGSRSMKMNSMGGGMKGGGMTDGMMGGMGGMMSGQGGYMQAQTLVQRIQETIEPDSWHGRSDTGEGTIMAYPMHSPRKLAVMQTYKIHQQIMRFLEDTRSALREWEKTNPEIMIETVFLSVSEDYLKYVGLDANTANFSDGWTRHLAVKYPAGPNGQPYGLIIDDLHVRFLLRAVQAHNDSKALVAPRVRTRAGTTADIGTPEEYRYIKSYNEPNSPSEEPQPKRVKEKIGTHIWITPKLTDNNRNINLDLKLEMRQLKGIIEGKYKEKYPYYKPIIDVISAKMPCTIPKGKIMLIGGLKIIEPIIKEQGTPGLKDLPLIGAAFNSNDKIKEQKMLLILVKPVINPTSKPRQ